MRKLLVVAVVVAGFAGLVGLGVVTALLGGTSRGGNGWSQCSTGIGPWGNGAGRGARQAAGMDPESRRVAEAIIEIGQRRELPPRAMQIAIQAGQTESGLANLTYGDRDSVGIFQMRPSMGWGTAAQLTDVEYQINKFYDVLLEVEGWKEMRPGTAAQRVERSAYPLRYHEWEAMAAHLVSTSTDAGGFSGCENLPDSGELASKAIAYAMNQIGDPYVWGAAGPDSFDCSGLTQQAWKAAGVTIPKYSQSQYHQGGVKVPLAEARPGDLIFWGYERTPGTIHHVALYLGNNEVLHAPQPGEAVERTKMWDGGELLPMAVRPVPDEPAGAAASAVQDATQEPGAEPTAPPSGERAGVLPAPVDPDAPAAPTANVPGTPPSRTEPSAPEVLPTRAPAGENVPAPDAGPGPQLLQPGG